MLPIRMRRGKAAKPAFMRADGMPRLRIENPRVGGSIPPQATKNIKGLREIAAPFCLGNETRYETFVAYPVLGSAGLAYHGDPVVEELLWKTARLRDGVRTAYNGALAAESAYRNEHGASSRPSTACGGSCPTSSSYNCTGAVTTS